MDAVDNQRVLIGHRIALTGRFAWLTRQEAKRVIVQCGGESVDRVNRSTTLLVVGSHGWPLQRDGRLTRNLARTRALQRDGAAIEIVTERDFMSRIGIDTTEDVVGRYTLSQLCEMVHLDRRELRSWLRAGLIEPVECRGTTEYFDFQQVCLVKILSRLRRDGVTTRRLQKSLTQLQSWLPDAAAGLRHLDVIEGRLIVRRDGCTATTTGQRLLEFEVPDWVEDAVVRLQNTATQASAAEWFSAGVASEEAGDLESAVPCYRQCLQLNDAPREAVFNLANALWELGRLEAAEERFWQVVEQDPESTNAWCNLGLLLFDQRRTEEAMAAWKRAIQIDPAHEQSLFNLADALHEMGHLHEARPYWQAYLQTNPTGEHAQFARLCLQTDTA
jgi:cytochrome c-type biogenesis protein CcmH/NrfG